MNDLGNRVFPQVADKVGVRRCLVSIVDTGESLDLSRPGSLVQSSSVDLLAPFQRRGNVDEEVVSTLASDLVLDGFPRLLVLGSWGGDDGGSGLCKLGSDETDPQQVLVLLLGCAAKRLWVVRVADVLTEQ